MTSQIPPRSLELVSDVQEADEEWLLVVGASDATSPCMLLPFQELDYTPLSESFDNLSWFSFDGSRRDSSEQTDARSLASSTADSAASTVSDDDDEELGILTELHWDEVLELPMLDLSLKNLHKLPRYYTALSDDDMQALSRGIKNHNLKTWSPEDTIKYHEARKNLIPLVMPKVEKMNALADIEHDRQYAQRAMTTDGSVRPAFLLPAIRVIDCNNKEQGDAASSSRSSLSSPMNTPGTSSPQPTSLHTRASITGDTSPPIDHRSYNLYHHHRRRHISPLASPSSSSSSGPSSSPHIRSPLAPQVPFRINPDVTFDSFLVPHKSGKGEILPGATNKSKSKSKSKVGKAVLLGKLRK